MSGVWDQLMDAITRPPRDEYTEGHLIGGARATFSLSQRGMPRQKYYREDTVLVNSRGLKLSCSHYRPCVVNSEDGRVPCVIYCHANSGSRRDAEEIVYTLLPYNISVFAMDFSGSGTSEGSWVTLGAHEVDDLEVVVRYLRSECGHHVSTIGLWGRSMGAVTALMYSHRDPCIAAVVADSPFSNLIDLMVELATNKEHGMAIPKAVVKVLLTFMRRSIRKRAGFRIDDVSPIALMPETYVPTLFGHGKEDYFIPLHHSEALFVAHGAETKNFVAFEGDHNAVRPDYWYDNGMTFMLSALHIDITRYRDPDHLRDVKCEDSEEEEGEGEEEKEQQQQLQQQQHGCETHHSGTDQNIHHVPTHNNSSSVDSRNSSIDRKTPEGPQSASRDSDEDAILQRVLELSLTERHPIPRELDDQDLERALKESLKESQPSVVEAKDMEFQQGPSTGFKE